MSQPTNSDVNNDNGGQQSTEIIQLSQRLDKTLKDQEIEPDGLNPQRNELYKHYFELLLTLLDEYDTCSDLVILLSRFKDELTMTSASYKKLYESSVTFGIQKALTARREKDDLKTKILMLQEEKQSLQDQNEFLSRKVVVLEQKVESSRYSRTNSDKVGRTDSNNDTERRRSKRAPRRWKKVEQYKLELKRMKDHNEVIKQHVEECLIQGHEEVYNAALTHS